MSHPRVCFLLESLCLSGGVGVVVRHARGLAEDHGFEVTLAMTLAEFDHYDHEGLEQIEVIALSEARRREYDLAVATWWGTVYELFTVPARRHVHFVQSLEDRFYHPSREERALAALALAAPASFVTEASWIRRTLAELRPDASCHLVRNGIDKDVFALPEKLEVRLDPPLRVLVEGLPGVGHKGVHEAIAALEATREPCEATFVSSERGAFDGVRVPGRVVGPLTLREMAALYGEHDVVLKTSRVEGMYGPPLEGFHRGATCVTTPVTGHEEYIRHGRNAIVVDWDDPAGTGRWLDTLARDRRRLHVLRANALETARGWPSWRQSTDFMASALRAILREQPPAAGGGFAYAGAATRANLMEMARSQRRLVTDADWMLNVRESSPTDVVMRYRHQGGSAADLVGAVVGNGAKGVLRRGWGRVRARAAARRGRR
jgi:hypothetical protein